MEPAGGVHMRCGRELKAKSEKSTEVDKKQQAKGGGMVHKKAENIPEWYAEAGPLRAQNSHSRCSTFWEGSSTQI